jgi:hypothetical protein
MTGAKVTFGANAFKGYPVARMAVESARRRGADDGELLMTYNRHVGGMMRKHRQEIRRITLIPKPTRAKVTAGRCASVADSSSSGGSSGGSDDSGGSDGDGDQPSHSRIASLASGLEAGAFVTLAYTILNACASFFGVRG